MNKIQNSRALTDEQKEDLEGLPEGFKKNIEQLLSTFDERSKGREQVLRMKLEETLLKFHAKLEQEGIDEVTKGRLLAKARKQIEAFFTK
jgi:hypothetical protein